MTIEVGFDIDGVLADFGYGMLCKAERMGYPVVPTPTGAYLGWSPALPEEDIKAVWKAIDRDALFWPDLPTLYTTPELALMRRMHGPVRFHYITSRPAYSRDDTYWWLRNRGLPDFANLIVTNDKRQAVDRLGIEFYIDDKPSNVLELEHWTKVHVMDWPYNREGLDGIPRVSSVGEFLAIVAREAGVLPR